MLFSSLKQSRFATAKDVAESVKNLLRPILDEKLQNQSVSWKNFKALYKQQIFEFSVRIVKVHVLLIHIWVKFEKLLHEVMLNLVSMEIKVNSKLILFHTISILIAAFYVRASILGSCPYGFISWWKWNDSNFFEMDNFVFAALS